MIDWLVQGESFSNCNCDHACPCQFEGLPTHHACEGFEVFRVGNGHFGDVELAGVVAVVLYAWPGPIFEGKGELQIIIDEKASPEQRAAIEAICMGKETLEAVTHWWVFSTMSDTHHETLVKPIEFRVNREARTAAVRIPGILDAHGSPIRNPHDGAAHRVQIRCPDGIEFEVAEIGNGSCEATAAIRLDLKDTYGQFNYLDHTGEGPAHVRQH